jgi:hypothetical protein
MVRLLNASSLLGGILALATFWGGADRQCWAQVPFGPPQAKTNDQSTGKDEKYVPPEALVRKSFESPPGGVALTRNNQLWIDRTQKRVYVDGYVAMRRGALEMFACPIGTKEHESIVATLAKSREVHAALLAVGAVPGTPVRHIPKYVPATGQVIRVWVCWRDKEDKFHCSDARKWVKRRSDNQDMKAEWVFAGSSFWVDKSAGREYYEADAGDMICVSNFATAMIDVNISSSAEADSLQYMPFEKRIPDIGTPVRLVLVPIPNPTDKPAEKPKSDPNDPPPEKVLVRKRGTDRSKNSEASEP